MSGVTAASMARRRHRQRRGCEGGFVAGAEALILGVLVFVFGTLVILNGWAVLDAKFAASAASREAVRAVVESSAGVEADGLVDRAAAAAAEAILAHGYEPDVLQLHHVSQLPAARCEPVRVRVVIAVSSTIVPGLSGPATFQVGAEYEEVMDPYRSGLVGGADCGF